jgi:hypothetical protein
MFPTLYTSGSFRTPMNSHIERPTLLAVPGWIGTSTASTRIK